MVLRVDDGVQKLDALDTVDSLSCSERGEAAQRLKARNACTDSVVDMINLRL